MGARLAPITDRLLPAWFLLWSAFRLYQLSWDGFRWDTTFVAGDFRIYRQAADALLRGADPWGTFVTWNGTHWHFAALPTAAQAFVPFALLPETVAALGYYILTIGVTSLALRQLGLPVWWLLFPPLMEGLYAGNPQILLFGLLVIVLRPGQTAAARALAVSLKVFAVVPIVARREWRAVGATILLLAASFAISPGLWLTYLGQFSAISARLVHEAQGGVSAALLLDPKVFGPAVEGLGPLAIVPGLLLYGLVAGLVLLVALRDVRSAGWLAVPLLWPAGEYYYGTFALPVARRLSIWVISIATLPTYLLGLILLAYEVTAGRRAIVHEPPPVTLAAWLRSLLGARRRVPRRPRPARRPPTPDPAPGRTRLPPPS